MAKIFDLVQNFWSMNDPLGLLTDKTTASTPTNEFAEASVAWSKLMKSDTPIARFLAHGHLFLVLIGFSVVLGAITGILHLPLSAYIVFGLIYFGTLIPAMRN